MVPMELHHIVEQESGEACHVHLHLLAEPHVSRHHVEQEGLNVFYAPVLNGGHIV